MDAESLGRELLDYCYKYKVPVEYIMDILIDQKVVPMIRGKATEYDVYLLLKRKLNPHEWSVEKLNLNAQTGTHDEDVTVTHQRTGIIIKVECKNATRGSFKLAKDRGTKQVYPKLTIKCHKSRSDLSKAETTNDRYLLGDFDVVISNMSNAVIAGATYTADFELVKDENAIARLAAFYGVKPVYQEIFDAAYNDWRFALSEDLAVNGVIPRTPVVMLEDFSVWHKIDDIDSYLSTFVRNHLNRRKTRR